MRDPVELTLRGVARSAALERFVVEQAQALRRQCDRIEACQVTIEALDQRKQRGAQFAVRLDITLPGTEVVVNREHAADVYFALRDAFEAAGLQLKAHARRQTDAGPLTRTQGPGTPRG